MVLDLILDRSLWMDHSGLTYSGKAEHLLLHNSSLFSCQWCPLWLGPSKFKIQRRAWVCVLLLLKPSASACWTVGPFLFKIFFNDFYFFHYAWFTVFCQFSTVQQSDPVIYIYICMFVYAYIHSFSHIILLKADFSLFFECLGVGKKSTARSMDFYCLVVLGFPVSPTRQGLSKRTDWRLCQWFRTICEVVHGGDGRG